MEFKRVVFNKRFLLIVALLISFVFFDFYNTISHKDDEQVIIEYDDYYEEENTKKDYNEEYHNDIVRILNRAESLYKRSTDELERAKIKKTLQDFRKLTNVTVQECNEASLDNVTANRRALVILIIIGVLLVSSFFEERKRGLWYFVHSSVRGRASLAVRRLGIVCVTMSILTCLVYSGLFAINWYIEGVPDFGIAIQSYSEYAQLTELITVGEFLIYFIVIKIISVLTVALMVWFMMCILGNVGLGIISSLLIITIEALLHTMIGPNDVGSIFRNINIYYLIDTEDWIKNYILYGTKGLLFERRHILEILAGTIFVSCAAGTVVINSFKKPFVYNGIYKTIIEKECVGKIISHIPSWTAEFRKVLCWCGGIFVLICAFMWADYNFELTDVTFKNSRTLKTSYYEACKGKSLDEVEDFLEKRMVEAQEEDELRRQHIEMVVGELRLRLMYVREQTALGRDVRMLDDEPYSMYYGHREKMKRKIHMAIAVVVLVVICSNIWSFENKSNTIKSFFAMKSGRKKLYRDKIALVIGIVLVVYVAIFGSYLYIHNHEYGFPFWGLSVYNVQTLQAVRFDVSIGAYLVMGEMLRFIWLLTTGVVTGIISRYQTGEKTMLIGILIFGLPILISIL